MRWDRKNKKKIILTQRREEEGFPTNPLCGLAPLREINSSFESGAQPLRCFAKTSFVRRHISSDKTWPMPGSI